MCRSERATWAHQVYVGTEQHKFDELLLLCVWASVPTTAWYVAICLLPARGRYLAAIITDSYSAFELYCLVRGHMLPTTAWGRSLAATRPATLRLSYYCLVRGYLLYQRMDVLSQLLLDSSLHVGFRNYQSSPTWRARTENKKSQSSFQRVQQCCHARSSRLLGQRLCDSMHVVCASTTENTVVCTDFSSIIHCLLSSDPKIS